MSMGLGSAAGWVRRGQGPGSWGVCPHVCQPLAPRSVGAALLGGVGGCLVRDRGGSPALSLLPGPGGAALRRRSAAMGERGRGCLRWRKCVGGLGVTGWGGRGKASPGGGGADRAAGLPGWLRGVRSGGRLGVSCPAARWELWSSGLPRGKPRCDWLGGTRGIQRGQQEEVRLCALGPRPSGLAGLLCPEACWEL